MKERKGIRDFMDIDRTEVVENIFSWCDGELVLENGHWDIPGWTKEKKKRRFDNLSKDTMVTRSLLEQTVVQFWLGF